MTNFIYFLGRFHVLVLHLPIGILLLAALLEVLVRFPRFRPFEPILPTIWLLGANIDQDFTRSFTGDNSFNDIPGFDNPDITFFLGQ